MPTALIVEDEPEANKLLGMLIKLRGYRSASAYNGREAMEHLDRLAPDILFLDLMLPDVSGFEVCRAIKSARATCLVPLVIVSARIAERNRVDSFHAGADEFVPKPYTPDQIFDALRRAEALREQAARDRIEGTARFADLDEDDPAREFARLRSLVLGRSPLDVDEAGRVNAALERVESRIGDWAGKHPDAPPASVRYQLSHDGLVLDCVRISWLDSPDRPLAESLAADLAPFDEIHLKRDEDRLTLVKRWG